MKSPRNMSVVLLASAAPLIALLSAWAAQSPPQPAKSETSASPEGQADIDVVARERIARATGGVLGSKHDFSLLTGRAIDACAACHIPHTQAIRPQTLEEGKSVLEFYRIAGQREVLEPNRFTPGPTSLICLSCHNGVIASSTLGSAHAMLGDVRAGFDLPEGVPQRDHPIGIPYPTTRRDYHPAAMLAADGVVQLPEGRVECISCHDPHGAGGHPAMLVMSNRRSALCLACHIK